MSLVPKNAATTELKLPTGAWLVVALLFFIGALNYLDRIMIATTILPFAIIAFMLYAITRAFGDSNIMPMLCMVADPPYRTTGYGVLNFFSTIIGGIAIYAGGVLRDSNVNLSLMYQFAALTMIICATLLFMAKPISRSDRK
jgi:hypothetical protein